MATGIKKAPTPPTYHLAWALALVFSSSCYDQKAPQAPLPGPQALDDDEHGCRTPTLKDLEKQWAQQAPSPKGAFEGTGGCDPSQGVLK